MRFGRCLAVTQSLLPVRRVVKQQAMATMVGSRRMAQTDDPVMVRMQELLRGRDGVLSLAQGIVHWQPPAEAMDAARSAVEDGSAHRYGADEGIAELRQAVSDRLRLKKGAPDIETMITAGANQAYLNVVLSVCDDGDAAVLFAPYYFNHNMALQMSGCDVRLLEMTKDLQPDIASLERLFAQERVKMVTLVNPGNPTGTLIPRETLQAVAALCSEHGAWLVVDNTYEHFVYGEEQEHDCVWGANVINLFSFSKAYGLMGWRCGYLAHQCPALQPLLLKVQDTAVICASVVGQRAALGAMDAGDDWVRDKVQSLRKQKQVLLDALAQSLGPDAVCGKSDGAIYLFCKLPEGISDDEHLLEYLVRDHDVAVVPGSACGSPGYIRVCYSNLSLKNTIEAAKRLQGGLTEALRLANNKTW